MRVGSQLGTNCAWSRFFGGNYLQKTYSQARGPLDCAHRELLGRRRKGWLFSPLPPPDGFTDELIHLYIATELTFEGSDPDADEFINAGLVPLSELVDADFSMAKSRTQRLSCFICDSIPHRLPMGQCM